METYIDRRTLIAAGAAATVAAGAAAGMGAATAKADSEPSTTGGISKTQFNAYDDINWDNVNPIETVEPPAEYAAETTVLIIGFGLGGTMAALQLANAGVDFIAVEASPRDTWDEHAGVQVLAGAGGSRWAAAKGIEWTDEDVPKLVNQLMDSNDQMVNRAVIQAHVENFDDMLASLEGIGCEFEAVDLSDSFGVASETYSSCTFTCVKNDVATYTASDPWVNKYHGAENAIERYIESTGAGNMLFGTPATALIEDADGNIVGAMVKNDNGEFAIKADITLIATGGYGANLDMCKADGYTTQFCGVYVGSSTNKGDGIRMAMGAGACLSCFGAVGVADGGPDALREGQPWIWRESDFFNGEHSASAYTRPLIQLCRQPTLKINAEGKRFMDENGTWQAKTQSAYVQPGKHFYTIFAGNIQEQIDFIKASRYGMCENMITPAFRIYFTDDDIEPLWEWSEVIAEDNEKFHTYYEADTIEELAEQIGVDAETFQATVDRYNELCYQGEDTDFGKHSSFLYPIDQPPYIAVEAKPAFLWTTQGGLAVNENFQVLRDNGKSTIGGLYCGSDDLGGSIKPFDQGMETLYQQAAAAALNGYCAAKNIIAALEA
jgi:hypothetical protein